MNLIKFDPFIRCTNRPGFFDDFLNRGIGEFVGTDYAMSIPSVNFLETENGFRLELAAPGLDKEDFKISADKNILKITASKEGKSETSEGKYTRREFNYTSFTRSFNLPKSIDKDAINASYIDGILHIDLPKKAELLNEEKERVIEIG